MTTETAEERLKNTFFVVEATGFEQFCLWQQHSKESPHKVYGEGIAWEQVNPGWAVTVGGLDSRPVVLSLSWSRVGGQLVMFWHQCSQVTDSLQAEAWIDSHFDGKWDHGTRSAKTDAQNFSHCIHAIRGLQAVKP